MTGAIADDIPTPPSSIPGSSPQKVACTPSCENQIIEPVSTAIPPATNGLGPIRSESRPACGASRMISSVQGKKLAPAWIAE